MRRAAYVALVITVTIWIVFCGTVLVLLLLEQMGIVSSPGPQLNHSIRYNLDEYSDTKLVNELLSRTLKRQELLCDYCNQSPNEPNCKFPERHKVVDQPHWKIERTK